jgi:hypothetical protein
MNTQIEMADSSDEQRLRVAEKLFDDENFDECIRMAKRNLA